MLLTLSSLKWGRDDCLDLRADVRCEKYFAKRQRYQRGKTKAYKAINLWSHGSTFEAMLRIVIICPSSITISRNMFHNGPIFLLVPNDVCSMMNQLDPLHYFKHNHTHFGDVLTTNDTANRNWKWQCQICSVFKGLTCRIDWVSGIEHLAAHRMSDLHT